MRAVGAGAVSVVVLLLLAVVAAGGIAGAATGPPLTKDQYVAAYNALCDAAEMKVGTASLRKSAKSNEGWAKAVVPIVERRLAQTGKLVPPRSDATKVKQLIAAQQDAINQLKDNSDVISGNEGPDKIFRKSVGKHAEKLAKAYGLESGTCLTSKVEAPPGSPSGGPPPAPCPGVGPCAMPGGSGSSGGPGPPGTTPAQQWVTAVCAAENTLNDALKPQLAAVQSARDAAAQKQGFVTFISGLPKHLKTLERAIKKAGAPDIGNGKAIAKTYLDTLKAMAKKVPALKTMAESLPTSSTDALQTAGKAIGQVLDDIKRGGDAHVAFLDPDHVVSQGLSACGGIFPL